MLRGHRARCCVFDCFFVRFVWGGGVCVCVRFFGEEGGLSCGSSVGAGGGGGVCHKGRVSMWVDTSGCTYVFAF